MLTSTCSRSLGLCSLLATCYSLLATLCRCGDTTLSDKQALAHGRSSAPVLPLEISSKALGSSAAMHIGPPMDQRQPCSQAVSAKVPPHGSTIELYRKGTHSGGEPLSKLAPEYMIILRSGPALTQSQDLLENCRKILASN